MLTDFIDKLYEFEQKLSQILHVDNQMTETSGLWKNNKQRLSILGQLMNTWKKKHASSKQYECLDNELKEMDMVRFRNEMCPRLD